MKLVFPLFLLAMTNLTLAGQGDCLGRMKYKYLDSGIKLYTTVAVWDNPRGDGNSDELGTSYAVSFPASVSGHKFLWAQVFFGKDRGKPIIETTLNVIREDVGFGKDVLTGKFSTSLEDEPFYIRVEYMIECSQIILEQRFKP